MVGLQILNLPIGVRVPVSQPTSQSGSYERIAPKQLLRANRTPISNGNESTAISILAVFRFSNPRTQSKSMTISNGISALRPLSLPSQYPVRTCVINRAVQSAKRSSIEESETAMRI